MKDAKPKRIGTYTQFQKNHPVYEYRGYIIVRCWFVQNYFEIYNHFENGKPSCFDWYLNCDKGFSRLRDAVSAIDYKLEGKS
jgi:hypothetical protein